MLPARCHPDTDDNGYYASPQEATDSVRERLESIYAPRFEHLGCVVGYEYNFYTLRGQPDWLCHFLKIHMIISVDTLR